MGALSGGQRRGVAIARAMHVKSRVPIRDEATDHLSVKETSTVIGFVTSRAAQGVTGNFISHDRHHVFACCDRAVAMANGKVMPDKPIRETAIADVHDVL